MYEQAALFGLYAETPLHPGTGQALGAVDLPVQRERHTGYPLIPGSSVKGVLRAAAESALGPEHARVLAVFGPGNRGAGEYAGALGLTDARTLLFPVRSLFGVFAWLTCPLVLERFRRDATLAGLRLSWPDGGELVPARHGALVPPRSAVASNGEAVLEEFTFRAEERSQVEAVARAIGAWVLPELPEYGPWRERVPRHLVVLSDNDFADFVRFATEVVARIALDDTTKTTSEDGGNLWYEEQIPSETVLYGLALASRPRRSADGLASAGDVLHFLGELGLRRVQIGGDETVGRGIVALRLNRGGQEGGAP